MLASSLPVRPDPPRTRTSILWRTMRQFALLATFSILLFSGALFIAARPLPSGLVSLFIILGGLVFTLGIVLAYFLAKSLTAPITTLSKRVARLGPDHWDYQSFVGSSDELALLDWIIADMSHRLERKYASLQDEVEQRTQELKEQYLKDRTILTSLHHGVVVTDAQGRVADLNPAALQMMGALSLEQVLGRSAAEMLPLSYHHQPLSLEKHPVTLCLRMRREVRPEPQEQMSLERPDRTRIPVMLLINPLLSGTVLLGSVVVFHDVTEERKLDYMKSEFISLASHQLRTPLSAMSWYLELLQTDDRERLSDTQQSYIAEMSSASQRMSRLIDALLHVSKLEGGGVAPVDQELDLIGLVRDVAEDERSLAKDRKISMELILPSSLIVATDPTLIQIVLHNLLSNAVKYSEAGDAITVRLTQESERISITIQDTGLGIPQAEQKYLFTRLFRASNATKADTTGSGLGLYISRMIAEQLHGHLSFQSTEGQGTTFIFELPLKVWKKI